MGFLPEFLLGFRIPLNVPSWILPEVSSIRNSSRNFFRDFSRNLISHFFFQEFGSRFLREFPLGLLRKLLLRFFLDFFRSLRIPLSEISSGGQFLIDQKFHLVFLNKFHPSFKFPLELLKEFLLELP